MLGLLSTEDPEYVPLARMLEHRFAKLPNLNISAEDEMYALGEAVCGSRTLGLMSYFRSGMQIADAVRQLVDWYFASASRQIRLLEFDSGHGRSARFLSLEFGPENVWAGGFSPDSLQFLASEFQLNVILATQRPESFQPGMQWDCIFVNSFFNQLSEVEFTRWLWKLHSLLNAGGLLIFTAAYPGSPVSLGFVHQSIIAVTGSLDHVRIPQGLCFTHDLFAIAKGRLPTEPIHFQYGPNGCVDTCQWTEPYRMKLTGWALDPTPGESIARVDLYYNGRHRASTTINHNRVDIAAIPCGWDCIAELEGENIRPSVDWILVKAISTSGREFVLRLDHPANIAEFESMPGWEYDDSLGKSRAILPVKSFVDHPVNGRFTSTDVRLSGWIACGDAESLENAFSCRPIR